MSQTELDFKTVLTQFFQKYRRQKLHRVDQLAEQFAGQEEEIMMLLCRKYKVDPSNVEGIDLSAKIDELNERAEEQAQHASHDEQDHEEHQEEVEYEEEGDKEEAPKKKGKVMLVIILATLVGMGGAFFAFGGMDIIGGDSGEAEAGDSTAVHEEITEEELMDSTEVMDSTKIIDSTELIDSAQIEDSSSNKEEEHAEEEH
jgi:hypothetical protein